MLIEFRKFKGWSVIEYFLRNPRARIHIKRLARELGTSSRTALEYLKSFEREGLLSCERIANASVYALRNEDALVKALKRFYGLAVLREKRFVENALKENPRATTIALYGSFASGDYDDKSDFDLLLISEDKTPPRKAASLLEREATLNVVTLGEWRKKNKEFKESVLANHVVLYGAGLVTN